MNNNQALKILAELLDAYDIQEHGDYFYDHSEEVCQAVILARGALEFSINLQTPLKPIMENWNPSKCPTCNTSFQDLEPCDDGYYQRAYSLSRCPYCGQKLDW